MNKTEVTNKLAEKTGIAQAICSTVMDALEDVSGKTLLNRIKGAKLNEAAAEIAAKANIPEEDCRAILSAFEETFGEALSDKFRFIKN